MDLTVFNSTVLDFGLLYFDQHKYTLSRGEVGHLCGTARVSGV